MEDILSVVTSLIAGSIRVSIPIAFAALGGTLSERSGIINMGLEGTMLIGAFFGVVGSYFTGNVWLGLLTAMLAGALCGLLHGVLTIRFKCEHVLAGVGINVLASGLTVVLLQMIWDTKGKSAEVASFSNISLPVVNQIPVLKEILGEVSPLLILLAVSVVGVWFLLYRTVFGLRARVIGDVFIAPMLMGKTLPEILNSNQPIAARHGYAREEIVVAREDFGIYRHYECADCYGLPNIGMKICAYEAGTAAGCFARPLGRPVEVVETKCCANGDPYCEFEVHVG